MTIQRKTIPEEVQEWWQGIANASAGSSKELEIVLGWRKDWRAQIGTIRVREQTCAFRYQQKWLMTASSETPSPSSTSEGGKADKQRVDAAKSQPWTKIPLEKLLGEALTRAGWLRPQIDPWLWPRLIDLHRRSTRVDFVLDTNALIHGSGHFLAHLFADTCALYLSAVTQREHQDMRDRSKLAAELSELKLLDSKPDYGKVLEARCSYLAAQRFREVSGLPRIAWYTLVEDDTTLLLSRGQSSGDKISESDTAILRAVSRFINDRVNNVERFFVSGDAAVADRAGLELPKGSVIQTKPASLQEGRVYFPCSYCPGPEQGAMLLGATPAHLLWELLTVADWLEIRQLDPPAGGRWKLHAYDEHMWTSQRQTPWIKLETLSDLVPEPPNEMPPSAISEPLLPSIIDREVVPAAKATPASSPPVLQGLFAKENLPTTDSLLDRQAQTMEQLFPPIHLPVDVPDIVDSLRILPPMLFEFLAVLATHRPDADVSIPPLLKRNNEQAVSHLAKLAIQLRLAECVTREQIVPGPLAPWLVERWNAHDTESIAFLLRRFQPLDHVCQRDGVHDHQKDVLKHARSLAEQLGLGMKLDGAFLPGGGNPTLTSVRRAILAHFDTTAGRYPGRAYPMYELLVDVFLKRLGVSPVRAMLAWDRMKDAGIFADIDMRIGGSSSGKRNQAVLVPSKDRWEKRKVDLEAVRGYRDLVDQTARSLRHV